MFLKEFDLKKNDKYILIAITVFSLILTGYYIQFNQNLGIYCSDVYVYLLNALYFSGHNINSTYTIYLSPIICFLTSLLFNIGIKDATAIRITTGLFAIIGNIGFYLLLKTRFSRLLSLTGVILYSTFAINLTWLANGSIDIPGVSITIWTMLFGIIAINKNPKFYMIVFPMFVIGFFTRYTVVLIFPVLILYYLYKKGFKIEKSEARYIMIGIIIAALLAGILLKIIMDMSNYNLGLGSQLSGGISGAQGSNADLAYNTDVGYYITNFLNFISASKVTYYHKTPVLENPTVLSYLIIGILAIGSILFIRKNDYKISKGDLVPLAIFLIAILTFTRISSFITIILVLLGLLLLGKNSENQNGLLMLSWILVYLIFFSYYSIKVNRYIITAIPPLIYFILISIGLIQEKVKINSKIIPIVLIVLFLIQGFTFCFAFEQTNEFIAPQEMSDYIIHEIPNYEKEKIGVYNMRHFNWYLGENVTGIESDNITKIETSNISYYISDIPQNDLNNYKEIKNIDNLYLYKESV